MAERNLLADISKIVEKNNKICKRKDDLRKIVTDDLIAIGYNASVCKSKWEKSSSIPAGKFSTLISLNFFESNSHFKFKILDNYSAYQPLENYYAINLNSINLKAKSVSQFRILPSKLGSAILNSLICISTQVSTSTLM